MALIRANPLLWRWARFAGLDGALLIGAAHGVLPAVVAGTALHKAPQALASVSLSLTRSLILQVRESRAEPQ